MSAFQLLLCHLLLATSLLQLSRGHYPVVSQLASRSHLHHVLARSQWDDYYDSEPDRSLDGNAKAISLLFGKRTNEVGSSWQRHDTWSLTEMAEEFFANVLTSKKLWALGAVAGVGYLMYQGVWRYRPEWINKLCQRAPFCFWRANASKREKLINFEKPKGPLWATALPKSTFSLEPAQLAVIIIGIVALILLGLIILRRYATPLLTEESQQMMTRRTRKKGRKRSKKRRSKKRKEN